MEGWNVRSLPNSAKVEKGSNEDVEGRGGRCGSEERRYRARAESDADRGDEVNIRRFFVDGKRRWSSSVRKRFYHVSLISQVMADVPACRWW